MLEEDDVIVWVEKRLDSILNVHDSILKRTFRHSQKIVNNSLLHQ